MDRNPDRYLPAFKAGVALAALRDGRHYTELAARFGVTAGEIAEWVTVLEQGAEALFRSPTHEAGTDPSNIEALYRQIGRLMVERDALARRCGWSNTNDEDDDRDRPDVLIPQD